MPGRRQRRRVLNALRVLGSRGVTQADFLAPDVADGGDPITRLAARVHELRERGHAVESAGKRDGCTVYVLRERR